MPIIRKPAPGQLKADRMRMIYLRAEQQILKEITRKRNLGLVDYSEVAALQRVQQILRDMTTEAEEYAPVMIKMQFYGQEDFPSAPQGYENAGMLTTAQTSIVERLTENLMTDITFAAATAYESAENFLALGRTEADRFRMLTLEEVARLEAEGKGWNTIQREMAAKLEAQGITSFVDKAGRKWGLTQYCSMATRTTQRQAQVAAALTADDWDLWQISKIGSTCPLCSTYEGRVYSKSGTDPDYPPLTMAFGKMDPAGMNDLSNSYLNIHPNCLHSLVRYTTAGKTDEQIQRDKDFSSFEKRPANVDYRTKKQQEAYRQKEAERAAFRRDMKQFNKYKAALGKDFPKTFETFEKHKKLKDDVYKGWEEKFRSLSAEKMAIPYSSEEPFKKLERIKLEESQRQSIIDFASDKNINIHDIRKFFGDPDLLKEQIKTLKMIKDDLGYKGNISIGFKSTINDDYAETTKKGSILFNSYALIDRELTVLSMTAQDGMYTLSAKDMAGISAHEMGHVFRKLKKRDNTIEIAKQAYYNIGKELSDIDIRKLLKKEISTYAFAQVDEYGDPIELLPEILAKHYTNPDSFTNEFVRLLREEMTRW